MPRGGPPLPARCRSPTIRKVTFFPARPVLADVCVKLPPGGTYVGTVLSQIQTVQQPS